MRLTILFILLSAFAFGQGYTVKPRLVTVPVSHDTTYVTHHDSTYTVYDTTYTDTLFRGFYVNSFNTIVSDAAKQNAFITDANKLKLTSISCYSISTTNNPSALALFLARIKRETKIKTICPAVSSLSGIDSWATWNNSHPDSSDVSGVTLEYEAYNQTDVKTAWKTNCSFYQRMYYHYKNGTFKVFNDYKGWWTSSTRDLTPMPTQTPDTEVFYFSIGQNELNLHDYRVQPEYSYMDKRLNDLNNSGIESNKVIRVAVLFSAEPDFMGPWLKSGHTLDEAFTVVYNAFKLKGYTKVKLIGWMCFHLDYYRANQPASAPMMMARGAAPTVFSEKGFKNKTTRKHKKVANHIE